MEDPSLTLCPIVLYDVKRFIRTKFSRKILNARNDTELVYASKFKNMKLDDYLDTFFNGEKYDTTVVTSSDVPIFLATRIIDGGKKICDKAYVFATPYGDNGNYAGSTLKFYQTYDYSFYLL